MKSRIWQSVLVGVFLVAGIVAAINFTVNKPPEKYEKNGLPVIDISLKDISLEDFKSGDKETVYEGNEVALINNETESAFYNVELKGRGNSTWGEDKKPFQIKFRHAVDFLGMGKARKWVFLANRLDATNLRNDIAFRLAEMLDDKPQRGQFVEVYFNGEYEGLYYVMHRVEIGKSSVDLRDELGVLMEVDAPSRTEDCHKSLLGGCLVLKETVNNNSEDSENLALKEFLEDYEEAERAAVDGDYEKVSEYLNLVSFARYFLVSEFTVNPDAYSMSFYLHKNGSEDKIHAGPMWDFDYALGNREWGWTVREDFYSPEEIMILRRNAFGTDGIEENQDISKLIYYLMEMPEFVEIVKNIFNERLSGRAAEFEVIVTSMVKDLRPAILRDTEKWEKDDFDAEMEYLLDWISRRYARLEQEFGDPEGTKNLRVY